ncbi:DUF3750 domain-containing protein [Aquibium sp. A9E412]|uniref:DUF3750 domain-containing protein n=1 Tax=Aquibium sp. A9E412 TaxID=2976767 RepID=UPI0025B190D5|nr:DUF3750 domain-containing protein [Aquibium sp. A9E412]MDN2566382.1 DUF3750 domain-containing protein [Aquibium sp. A9E412]
MRLVKRCALALLLVFLVPAAATAGWWALKERPASWHAADWSASGVLPPPAGDAEAAVYLMAARTGGLKGAFSVHSWLVVKKPGAAAYERYDKVGWGRPVRRNGYPADGRWYSNRPVVVHAVRGRRAEALIPHIEAAIAAYPFARRGDYRLWPGPNSNSFVAHVLRAVPAFGARLPPNAVGRDYRPGLVALDWSAAPFELSATLGGVAGLSLGARSGFEVHLFGLVAGVDLARPALKIPAYGRLELLRR